MGICNSKDTGAPSTQNLAVVKKSNKQASATVPQSNSEDNMVSLREGGLLRCGGKKLFCWGRVGANG